MTKDSSDYFRLREKAERLAAQNATCEAARLAHEELAARYAALLRQTSGEATPPVPAARPLLSLVHPRAVQL